MHKILAYITDINESACQGQIWCELVKGNIQQYQITLRRPAALKSVYRVGIVGYKLCAGRLIESRMVPPYITQLFEAEQKLTINITYFKVIATQIYQNVVLARSLCALFDHVENIFSMNSRWGGFGCWVRSVPWGRGIFVSHS